jgi:hypothetical protein
MSRVGGMGKTRSRRQIALDGALVSAILRPRNGLGAAAGA